MAALVEQRAADAHFRAIAAARVGEQSKEALSKVEMREIADRAVAEFDGQIKKCPTRARR
jgi:hypothetical protein